MSLKSLNLHRLHRKSPKGHRDVCQDLVSILLTHGMGALSISSGWV